MLHNDQGNKETANKHSCHNTNTFVNFYFHVVLLYSQKVMILREQLHVQRAERHGKVGACVPPAGDLGEGGPGLPATEGQPARGGPARLWLPGGGGPACHPTRACQDGGRYP